jgi:small-conductance mechanosensitive channel
VIEEVETSTIITIPNRKIQDSIIQNHTRNPIRFVMYNLAVANKPIDMDKLKSSLNEELTPIKGVLKEPAPTVDIQDVTPFATILQIKVTIESRYFIDLNDPLRTKIREILIANKVQLKT